MADDDGGDDNNNNDDNDNTDADDFGHLKYCRGGWNDEQPFDTTTMLEWPWGTSGHDKTVAVLNFGIHFKNKGLQSKSRNKKAKQEKWLPSWNLKTTWNREESRTLSSCLMNNIFSHK